MSNLYIMAGVPGSGKSTYAETTFPLAVTVSSDFIREGIFGSLKAAHDGASKADNNRLVWTTFHDRIDSLLNDEYIQVVADATFLTRQSREKVLSIASRRGAKAHLVLFKNLSEADTRNAARDEDTQVPEDVQAYMHEKYFNTLSEIGEETYATVTTIESFT